MCIRDSARTHTYTHAHTHARNRYNRCTYGIFFNLINTWTLISNKDDITTGKITYNKSALINITVSVLENLCLFINI